MANCSISVDLPIRLRPRHVTSEETRLFQSEDSCSNKSSLPKNISNPYWIYYLTSFKEFRNFAEKKMTGSAGQKRIPVSAFNQILVNLPTMDLQNKFAAFVQQIDKSKFVVKQQISDLQEFLDSKMQEYFGE